MGQAKKAIKKEGKESEIIPGIILLLIGSFLLLDSLRIISFSFEYALLIIGSIFLVIYAFSKKTGFLIPGTMIFLFSIILLFDLAGLAYLWLLSVSLSFLIPYLLNKKKDSWAIWPGMIILAVASITLIKTYIQIDIFPIALIAIGGYLIYNGKRGKSK